MAGLRKMIAVLFILAVLIASYGVGVVGAAGPDADLETRLARRTQNVDFLRHNRGADVGVIKSEAGAGAALALRMSGTDFLRHNTGAGSYGAKAEVRLQRSTQRSDFLRHNVATPNVAHRHNKR